MYLDANFFIITNFDQGEKGINARHLLHKIKEGQRAMTSSLALDEVMWVILKNKQQKELRAVIEEIYKIANLEVTEVPSTIPLQALDIMEQTQLRPRDAFHVAMMNHFGIKEIISDDTDFDRIPGIKRIKI